MLGLASALSTVGVIVSIVVVGVAVHLLLGLDWRLALLYGAVLSSTDAAAVFATLRRLRLPPRLVATLEAESGMNDAPVVLLVVLLSHPGFGAHPWWYEVDWCSATSWASARRSAWPRALPAPGRCAGRRCPRPGSTRSPRWASPCWRTPPGRCCTPPGSSPSTWPGWCWATARLSHRQAILGFADGLAWLAQIGLFVLLGLLASPGRLDAAVLPAVVAGLALVLPGPAAVGGGLRRCRSGSGLREQAFLSWAGLRGAVPIVLATIPLSERVPGAERLFDAVFVLVVIFTLVQTGTLGPVARRLGVTAPAELTEMRVETAPLERMQADLLQLEMPPGSRLVGRARRRAAAAGGRLGDVGAARRRRASCRRRTPG